MTYLITDAAALNSILMFHFALLVDPLRGTQHQQHRR